jgi:hypothetical protein
MAVEKTSADVAAIPAKDGRVVIGGRTPTDEFYETLNRQGSGLAPKGARGVPAAPVASVSGLPMLGVARQVVGAEILRLRATEAAIERDRARGPFGASGAQNPYLIEQATQHRIGLENIREQIEGLSNLDDNQLRQKAYELGAR